MRRGLGVGVWLVCAGMLGSCALAPTSSVGATSRATTSPSTTSLVQSSPTVETPAGTPSPTPTTTVAEEPVVSIGWAGDAIPASRNVSLPSDPSTLLGPVAFLLREPDLMVLNLEGTLGSRGLSKCQRWRVADCHAFQAPSSYASAVFKEAGVDAVNTANNHSFDHGPEGQADTRAALAEQNIAVTGGEAEVTIVEREGVRIALVGLAPYGWGADFRDDAQVSELMARAEEADVVVVALHLGAEGTGAAHTPRSAEWYLGENRGDPRRLARRLVDLGADLVVGSGPHVVRSMEFYRGRLIAYSLGNLVGYGGAFVTGGDLSLSGVLTVDLDATGSFRDARLVPLWIGSDGIPRVDAKARSTRRVSELSRADFGDTAARVAPDGTIRAPSD